MLELLRTLQSRSSGYSQILRSSTPVQRRAAFCCTFFVGSVRACIMILKNDMSSSDASYRIYGSVCGVSEWSK
jgi:hypothetical protein